MIAIASFLHVFKLGLLLLATWSKVQAQIQDVTIVLSQGTIVGVIFGIYIHTPENLLNLLRISPC